MKFLKMLFPVMLIACSAHPQSSADSLTYHLNEYLNKSGLPGFSVVILNKRNSVYQKGFGYADLKNKRLFTPETIQNIGSVSKTFVAVALMKAIELNYFTLETNINDIPPFKVVNPYHPDEVIRIKDLTTHTSGIIDNDAIYNRSYRFRKSANLDETLGKFMQDRGYISDLSDTTLNGFLKAYLSPNGNLYSDKNFYNSKSGERASYSNISSALAAYLIEIKAGMSFAMFSEDEFEKKITKDFQTDFTSTTRKGGEGTTETAFDADAFASYMKKKGFSLVPNTMMDYNGTEDGINVTVTEKTASGERGGWIHQMDY